MNSKKESFEGADSRVPQSLKERFAALLPEKVEEIKALRKFVSPLDTPFKLRANMAIQGARLQGC